MHHSPTIIVLVNSQILFLSNGNGDSADALMRNILKRLLTNSLASKFVLSQDGQGKELFGKLLFFKVLTGKPMNNYNN